MNTHNEKPKLIDCPVCHGKVSTDARNCPHCGHPIITTLDIAKRKAKKFSNLFQTKKKEFEIQESTPKKVLTNDVRINGIRYHFRFMDEKERDKSVQEKQKFQPKDFEVNDTVLTIAMILFGLVVIGGIIGWIMFFLPLNFNLRLVFGILNFIVPLGFFYITSYYFKFSPTMFPGHWVKIPLIIRIIGTVIQGVITITLGALIYIAW